MNRIQAFGQTYRSIKSLARDPRCAVDYYLLWRRIRYYGWEPTEAATVPDDVSKYVVWGETFSSLGQIINDPRCEIDCRFTLTKRIRQGIPIQDAVLAQPEARLRFEVWGEQFTTLSDVVRDERCVPRYKTLVYRLKKGTPLEIAVQDKEAFLAWRRGEQCPTN